MHNYIYTFLAYGADVKHLAASFDVRIISTNHLPFTREIRFRQVIEVQILEKNQKSTRDSTEKKTSIGSLDDEFK